MQKDREHQNVLSIPLSKNKFIERYKDESRWIVWVPKESNGRMTKVPLGSSTDESTWGTIQEVSKKQKQLKQESNYSKVGIGVIFKPDMKLVGVDIDKVISEDRKFTRTDKEEEVTKFIEEADTYIEVSPSGTGFHAFFEINDPFGNEEDDNYPILHGNKKEPYEVYSAGRFFTFTGNTINNKEVRQVTKEQMDNILATIGYPFKTVETEEEKEIKKAKLPKVTKELKLPDDEVIRRMFLSKAGKEIEKVYNGDTSSFGSDESSADLSLCRYLAFWTGGDVSQVERIWLTSPLGGRGKTQERDDYRKRTIDTAMKGMTEFYEPKKSKKKNDENSNKVSNISTEYYKGVITVKDESEEIDSEVPKDVEIIDLDLLYTEKGKERIRVYSVNLENVSRILRKHPDFNGRFRFDIFQNLYEFQGKLGDKESWRPLEDADALIVQSELSIQFEFLRTVSKVLVYDAIVLVSKEKNYDSALEYINSLKWDGEDRLSSWLHHTYGAPLNKYNISVAENWMKGLVSRLIYPGCKFDYVLVLEGGQGSRKSTSLNILGMNGKWHVETTMSTESKDFFLQFFGNAIVEFSEGETLSRTEVKRMKAIITTQNDKYRPPYERATRAFPRRCVFAMTTNQYEYLKDETGNRRWFPVRVLLEQANTEWLSENRDQLYAEAYHRLVNLKETYYEFPKEEVEQEQRERVVSDANTDTVMEWYYNNLTQSMRDRGISTHDVFTKVFGRASTDMVKKKEEMDIGNILQGGLELERRRVQVNGIRKYLYFAQEGKSNVPSPYADEMERRDDPKPTTNEQKESLNELWESSLRPGQKRDDSTTSDDNF